MLICRWNLKLPPAFSGRGTVPLVPTVMEGCRRLAYWKRVEKGVSLRVEGLGKEKVEEGASGHY